MPAHSRLDTQAEYHCKAQRVFPSNPVAILWNCRRVSWTPTICCGGASMRRWLIVLGVLSIVPGIGFAREPETYKVGVAQVDITPTQYPVRLSGFGFRRTESEGVTQ